MSQGLPVQLVWILDDIGAAEVLVARNGSGIESLADLKGKKIGVPFTSTTHFHTMVALDAAKIDPASVRILNLRPPEVAAAWERGDIDATFIWEPVLSRVMANGKPLITSGEIAKQTGKATFDGVVANSDWAKANGEFIIALHQGDGRRRCGLPRQQGQVDGRIAAGEGGCRDQRRQG